MNRNIDITGSVNSQKNPDHWIEDLNVRSKRSALLVSTGYIWHVTFLTLTLLMFIVIDAVIIIYAVVRNTARALFDPRW